MCQYLFAPYRVLEKSFFDQIHWPAYKIFQFVLKVQKREIVFAGAFFETNQHVDITIG